MVSPKMFRVKKVSGVQGFKCPSCKEGKNIEEGDKELITTGGIIQEVYEFCYLGNILHCKAGLERAARARVAAAWTKWREMASLITNRSILLKIRGGVYKLSYCKFNYVVWWKDMGIDREIGIHLEKL